MTNIQLFIWVSFRWRCSWCKLLATSAVSSRLKRSLVPPTVYCKTVRHNWQCHWSPGTDDSVGTVGGVSFADVFLRCPGNESLRTQWVPLASCFVSEECAFGQSKLKKVRLVRGSNLGEDAMWKSEWFYRKSFFNTPQIFLIATKKTLPWVQWASQGHVLSVLCSLCVNLAWICFWITGFKFF